MSSKFDGLGLEVEKPSRMTIHHPAKGTPLRDCDGNEAYIDLLNPDGPKGRAFDRKVTTDRLSRRNRAAAPTGEQIEAEQTDKMVDLTTGWHLVDLDGNALNVPFSPADARELYSTPAMGWLRIAVQEHLANYSNFAKASSSSSSQQPNTTSGSTAE